MLLKTFNESEKMVVNMKKKEIVKIVAERIGLSQKDAALVIDEFLVAIEDGLAEGEKVQLSGFGSFSVRSRAKRKVRNPRTGEEIILPATLVPAFKPGLKLKEAIR